MRRYGTGRTRHGFSLLEVMFTVAIIGVCFAAILSLVSSNNALQLMNEQRSAAIILAERVLEEGRRTPYAELQERSLIEVPFNRGQSQQAEILIRLFDEGGNMIPKPEWQNFSLVRVQVTVNLNGVKEDGTPRTKWVARETLVTWMVPEQ